MTPIEYTTSTKRRYLLPAMLKTTRLPLRMLAFLYCALMSGGRFQFACRASWYQDRNACSLSGYCFQKISRVLLAITLITITVLRSHIVVNINVPIMVTIIFCLRWELPMFFLGPQFSRISSSLHGMRRNLVHTGICQTVETIIHEPNSIAQTSSKRSQLGSIAYISSGVFHDLSKSATDFVPRRSLAVASLEDSSSLVSGASLSRAQMISSINSR